MGHIRGQGRGFSDSKRVGPDFKEQGAESNEIVTVANLITSTGAASWGLKLATNPGAIPPNISFFSLPPRVSAHQLSELKFRKMSQNLTGTEKNSR